MAAVLDSVSSDIAQVANLFVTAELTNVWQIAAGVDNLNKAVLAHDHVGMGRILARSDAHDRTGCHCWHCGGCRGCKTQRPIHRSGRRGNSTAVLDHVDSDVGQIADLLVVAKVADISNIAAGVDDIDVAVLADNLARLRRVHAGSMRH